LYRTIGKTPISNIGFGCMGLSWAYSPSDAPSDTKLAVLHHALDTGVQLLDTADFYGPFVNEELVGQVLQSRRAEAFVSTKGGLVASEDFMAPNGRPEHLRKSCDGSLSRLGIEQIDLYQLHRVDPGVPLEDSWGAMAELVEQGKVRNLGLCEVTVEQLDVAQRIHPVASVQSELSIWERNALDNVLPWCHRHEAAFIAFAPLGRGFLTGTIPSTTTFDDGDFRSRNPRFSAEALALNRRVIDTIGEIAAAHEATAAQIALAWLLAVDSAVIPIPGTTKPSRIDENMAARNIVLTNDEFETLSNIPMPAQPRY
jgi:aryl-alcohol dehydrogenase-like predicted oxidoreductase